jgi:hypothetical protein
MNDVLRDRIWRNLEALPDDRLYQVADYIEFLSSKYARDNVRAPGSPFQAFGERLEDRMRVHRVGMTAIKGTMGVMGTADKVMTGITDMGRSLLRDVSGTGTGSGRGTDATQPEDRSRPKPLTLKDDIPIDG